MTASDRVPTASDALRTQAVPTASMRPCPVGTQTWDAVELGTKTSPNPSTASDALNPPRRGIPPRIRRPIIDDDPPGMIPTRVIDDALHERRTPADAHRLWQCPDCGTPRATFGGRTSPPPTTVASNADCRPPMSTTSTTATTTTPRTSNHSALRATEPRPSVKQHAHGNEDEHDNTTTKMNTRSAYDFISIQQTVGGAPRGSQPPPARAEPVPNPAAPNEKRRHVGPPGRHHHRAPPGA
jgi:hypothetical protein